MKYDIVDKSRHEKVLFIRDMITMDSNLEPREVEYYLGRFDFKQPIEGINKRVLHYMKVLKLEFEIKGYTNEGWTKVVEKYMKK